MILDYVNLVMLGGSGPVLEESEIAEVMKTTIAGTHLRNVKNINSVLGSSNPSIRFVAEFETHTLSDIRKELESRLPPAVWIVTSDGSNDYLHSVVITGIDDAKREISYNDPTYGEEKTISLSRFMDIWEAPGARMIKAEIRQAASDSLEQYMEQRGRAK